MAGRSTHRAAGTPALEKERAGHDSDFYTWSQEQGRLVREGRWNEVDREHIAEEIESLGWEQFNKLESALRVLLMRMLKWDHQPERRSRSWANSIATQRLDLSDVLADNPGLRPRIDEAILRAFRRLELRLQLKRGLREPNSPRSAPFRLTTSRREF